MRAFPRRAPFSQTGNAVHPHGVFSAWVDMTKVRSLRRGEPETKGRNLKLASWIPASLINFSAKIVSS